METKTLVEIVRKSQKGDGKAQQELYLDSGKSVYFLALKILRNKDDAEDITQDVFITVFEKISELKQPAAYYKWINQITANKCMSFLRKKKLMTGDEQDIIDILEPEDDDTSVMPEKLYDDEETRRLIMEIIDGLPDSQRVCVMYRYFNQLSVEEIAEITATNEHTVKSRLALARNKMRAAILEKEEKEGIRLHVIIPIMPVLMKALEDFQMPQGVSEQMWQKIAEGAGIAAGSTAAATAVSEAAKAGAKEAAKQGVKAKVIGGVTAAVAVVVVATVLLWPKPEQPAVLTPPPSSTPVVSQPVTPTPTQSPTIAEGFKNQSLEAAVRGALEISSDVEIADSDLKKVISVSLSGVKNERTYTILVNLSINKSYSLPDLEIESFDLSDMLLFTNLTDIRIVNPPPVSDYSVLGDLSEGFTSLYIEGAEDLTELPPMSKYYNFISLQLEGLPNLTKLPDFGEKTRIDGDIKVHNCGVTDISALAGLTDMASTSLTLNYLK